MEKKKMEIWPLGIVTAMALFIGGIVFAVSVMIRNDVPLVADDYYVQELAYQQQIDKMNRVREDGRTPKLDLRTATGGLEVEFPATAAGQAMAGAITFFRPSDPGLDFTVPVRPDEAGRQWVDLREVRTGLWRVRIDWKVGERSYYHESNLTL